jgi:REP element-mobilizing transposase RayT
MSSSQQPEWLDPITGFTTSRRHLPHLELPGSYYFTTTCTKVRGELAPLERDEVLSAILFMDGKKYDLDAAVVMPDHFHLLLHPLRKDENGYYRLSEIFHSIKSYSAKRIIALRQTLLVPEAKVWWPREQSATRRSSVPARHKTPSENKIWQDENHDHLIRNDKDYFEKLQYILYNAVKDGLAASPFEYPWLYWIGKPNE